MSADKQTRPRKPRKPQSDFQRLSRHFMSGLLRSLFLINKPTRAGQAGFVLPTAALLLLVLTLTVGAMSFRTFSRSSSVIAQRDQQVIDSAAAPVIDRAKAKLEYLFSRDTRFPGGVPASDVISSMILNDGTNGIPVLANSPYDFPGETRINIDGNPALDNAWIFQTDVDGDGTSDPNEVVVYSILMDDANDPGTGVVSMTSSSEVDKAKALVTRNGPINTAEALSGCGAFRAPEEGWQGLDSSTLQKNFQVTAFVANRSDVNRTASTLEFQQVRQADKGNKWGAWFKYDIELNPGASREFFWNGAMHTEGSLLANEKLTARMISSHNSCLYTQDASEITLAETPDFQGQFMAAKGGATDFANSRPAKFHLFNGDGTAPITSDLADGSYKVKLLKDNDSVKNTANIGDLLLDPIRLFTEDVLAHRRPGAGSDERDPNWEDNGFFTKKRIYNDKSAVPYLDDTFRADNRYGPKPRYDKSNAVPSGTAIGTQIPDSEDVLDALDAANDIYGLDGYWERRSIGQGLRIIVGQRLELGDTFGWTGSTEPLYPPNQGPNADYDPEDGTPNNNRYMPGNNTNAENGDKNDVFTEEIQRRTLYDNLAAVQSMVVYHHDSNDGQLPLACIAATVHPGTAETVENSRTFKNYPGTATLKTDFLTGNGTNGWEFDFYSSFSTKISSGQPLGIALRNLAYFAGDPSGGAPSFPPVQNAQVHPYPYQSMWGDYSNLRRVLSSVDSGTSYSDLSPADQTTLHSAACTIGMLAYNISSQQASEESLINAHFPNQGAANTLGADLMDAIGAENSGPRLGSLATSCLPVPISTYNYDCTNISIDKEAILAGSGLPSDKQNAVRAVGSIEQIARDRKYGFISPNDVGTVDYIGKRGSTKYLFRFAASCNPDDPSSIVADLFDGVGNGLTDSKAALALMCAPAAPKYPSLYYLFPNADHDQVGSSETITQWSTNEEYVRQPYLSDDTATTGVNRKTEVTYKVVGSVSSVALSPKPLSSWSLPKSDATGAFDPESMQISTPIGVKEIALLDKGMFEPRENMSIRILDFDVEKLSKNRNGTGDKWIAETDGIVYAFREDAVREDSIVRPKAAGVTWDDCDEWNESHAPYGNSLSPAMRNCRMKAISAYPYLQDPPLKDGNLISTKPVDFYADPDRRPNGFRLVNGISLNRAADVQSGMTFVSDNVVYIKGNFNLHKKFNQPGTCADLLEEFDKRLDHDCNGTESVDFYNGRTGDNGTPASARGFNYDKFAEPSFDSWRPVEIVGDAVGILSSRFRDGNIQDGFVINRQESRRSGEPTYGGNLKRGNGISSYMNQNRLECSNTNCTMPDKSAWKHAKPDDVTTPIVIDRNGQIIQQIVSTLFPDGIPFAREALLQFVDKRDHWNDRRGADVELPSQTVINAVLISGIIPSQLGQTYGGLHNFPRLSEWWQSIDLAISGGFFQLSFSTSATAPFDADAWEPGSVPTANGNRISYYGAADRSWGYDVGLQYAPAGPIARRFVSIGQPRSEFYRELPVEDPYVVNLRCAKYTPTGMSEQRVDPTVDSNSCPA